MAARTGRADLPLHGGRVPQWLAGRMSRLARVITEAIAIHYGRDEFLRRISHPFWFQSLGAVMGMDWHSSGITTSVMGALKRGLEPVAGELGIHVCGGRGRHGRKTPGELVDVGMRVGIDGEALAQTSRLVAKVDSAAVQDGFQLYLHSFVVSDDGHWVVVQQGMNGPRRQARRYHWLSEGLHSFVEEPHTGIEGPRQGEIINLTDRRAADSREAQVALVREGPERALREIRAVARSSTPQAGEAQHAPGRGRRAARPQPQLRLPMRHPIRESDVVLRRLQGVLAAAAERDPQDFENLLMTPGLGARTLESLALVSEVIHGAPCRFTDPARFSYAHGGKDGHPFPVPLAVYDETLRVLRRAVEHARLGNDDRLTAIKRLDQQARRLEGATRGESFAAILARERRDSHRHGGVTVSGSTRPRAAPQSKPSRKSPFSANR
jgi:hypothetical protein